MLAQAALVNGADLLEQNDGVLTEAYVVAGQCDEMCIRDRCHAVGIRRVQVVDPYDLAACDKAIKEELAANEPSVIISRRPCALLPSLRKALNGKWLFPP